MKGRSMLCPFPVHRSLFIGVEVRYGSRESTIVYRLCIVASGCWWFLRRPTPDEMRRT